ncbi:hypothetical protein DL96DRAFT_1152698 [Flagelloscypha sp. PMI_526]|nr:hypothetical protein DL96DRAFT_1152698 [Flagelloscypha sp. PMI_526]
MIGVLESCDWNLERAASLVFDHGASVSGPPAPGPSTVRAEPHQPPRTPSPLPVPLQNFEIDDSDQGNFESRDRPSSTSLTTVVAYPFTLIASLFRFIFRLVPWRFLPFSSLYRFWGGSGVKSNQSLDDWVRGLEEELGTNTAADEAQASSFEPSTSTNIGLTQRGRGIGEPSRLLPDFESRLTYEGFLRKCVTDVKIGCVILISEEHDSAAPFKRDTLSNPNFVNTLQTNDILVWAGPTHLLEPYKASLKLSSTTYPFVAFVALQPRRHSARGSGSEGTLTILSRHQGTDETSCEKLQNQIENVIIPRVMPHIYSVRREREEEATRQYLAVQNQAAERRLRAEQDAAYERAAANDRERIERKRREIEDAKWRAQQEAENMLREAERIRSEVAEKSGWRIWEEHHFGESSNVPAFNDAGGSKPVRVVLRMPTVEGRVWMLSPTTSITSLYARVDSLLLASTPTSDSTPLVPPLVSSVEEAEKILDSKLSALSSWNLFFPVYASSGVSEDGHSLDCQHQTYGC